MTSDLEGLPVVVPLLQHLAGQQRGRRDGDVVGDPGAVEHFVDAQTLLGIAAEASLDQVLRILMDGHMIGKTNLVCTCDMWRHWARGKVNSAEWILRFIPGEMASLGLSV